MVLGMNTGRGGDSRRGNTSRSKEKHRDSGDTKQSESPPVTLKHKPSAEQVHIAKLLTDDRTPDDMKERVLQVQAVVDCSEESIFVALHDNEFDVRKACESLLDSNGGSKEEWTTMKTSKKSKKKEQSQQPLQQKKTKPTVSSKAAAAHTRQTYGGSVTVKSNEERRPNNRSVGGVRIAPRGRGNRRNDTSQDSAQYQSRPRKSDRLPRVKETTDSPSTSAVVGRFSKGRTQESRHEELWDNNDNNNDNNTISINTSSKVELWDDEDINDNKDVEKSRDHTPSPLPSEEWVILDTPPELPPVIPRYNKSSNTSSPSSIIESRGTRTQRKYKASQIPSLPVEMPYSTGDKLAYDMSKLGIDFGAVETTPTNITEPEPSVDIPISSPAVATPISDSGHSLDQTPLNQVGMTTTGIGNTSLLSSSPFADITDDPVIISSYKERPPGNLEPPPGLVHPSQQPPNEPTSSAQIMPPPTHSNKGSTQIMPPPTHNTKSSTLHDKVQLIPPPEPISLPPPLSTTKSETPPTTNLLSANQSQDISYNIVLQNPTFSTASSVTTPTSAQSLFSVSSSVVTPPTAISTSSITAHSLSSTLSASTSSGPGGSGSGVGVAGSVGVTGGVGVAGVNTRLQNTYTQGKQAHNTVGTLGTGGGTGGNVHPMTANMMYPHLMPQFPVMMPPYTYDVDSMNRFPFYSQHPTSQDQGGGASLTSGLVRGDPQSVGGTLSFGLDNKYDSNTSTQSQPPQQGAVMQQPPPHNPTFYGHYPIYPMYHPHMGMATATATYGSTQIGHKPNPGAGTTYPAVGTSFQHTPQYSYDEEILKNMYNTKGAQVSSTAAPEFTYTNKHQFDSSKAPPTYSNYLPYVMGHHPMQPAVGTTPMISHDGTSRNKSHNKYISNTPAGWTGSSSAHS